uniref:Uncharacterized protein n=1 Tax=Amphimedon queenslandica TaxID=400682 RepID=A0A1X7TNL3_AMPQE
MAVTVVPTVLYTSEPQRNNSSYVYHKEIKSLFVACVVIWMLVTFISASLVRDIIRQGLGRSAFKNFHKILSLFSIIAYEVWMVGYIYHTYAINFNWSFKVIIFPPLLALLAHSIFQTFLSYDEHKLANNKQEMKDLKDYIVTSLGFNGIMTFHVLCMFVTASKIGISRDENFIYTITVAFLGFGEVMSRMYVMKNHFEQLKKINTLYATLMYSRAAVASYANPEGELVTGLVQDRKDFSYFTAQNAAVLAVAALGVIVAGNI